MFKKLDDTVLLDEMVELDDSELERVGGGGLGILGTSLFGIVSAVGPVVATAAPAEVPLFTAVTQFLARL